MATALSASLLTAQPAAAHSMVAPGVRRSAAAAAQEAREAEEEERQASVEALAHYSAFRQRLQSDLAVATAAREQLREEQRSYEELVGNIGMLQRVGAKYGWVRLVWKGV